MENRFGIKDFFLLLLMLVLIVSVWLAMKQYDRQWQELSSIRQRLDSQARDLRNIQDSLQQGIAVGPGPTSRASVPAAVDPAHDPFSRLREAQAMPNYARGGWLVDAFGNSVGKLTPLLS